MFLVFSVFDRGLFPCALFQCGLALFWLPVESYDPEAQIDIIERLTESRVDVITIAANHTDLLEDALKAAMDAGITVVSVDSSVNPVKFDVENIVQWRSVY
jgi:ABC-type sugar transport system substrate-binding protein